MELPPLPTLPITSQETLRKCRELPVGDKDIFICSFPKSGTTWMQNIVFQLINHVVTAKDKALPFDHISQYTPFYDIDAHWETDSDNLISKIRSAHENLGYRIFNTHLRWDMLPHNNNHDKARYIYVVRDGRDTLTSFYHHMTNQHPDDGGFEGDFEAFFQQFIDGTIAYGKWSHHLSSWIPHCTGDKNNEAQDNDNNILLVRYEDLKQDRKQEIIRIAKFLNLEKALLANTSKLEQVLERTSFEYMREHQELFHPISVRWKPGYNFIRKGSVGDHSSLFDEEHRKKFMEATIEDLGGKDQVPKWLFEYCFHD